MAHIKINTGARITLTADGAPIGNPNGYASRATAIQFIRMNGHTYDKLARGRKADPAKAKAKASAPKAGKTDWKAIIFRFSKLTSIEGYLDKTAPEGETVEARDKRTKGVFWACYHNGRKAVTGMPCKHDLPPRISEASATKVYNWAHALKSQVLKATAEAPKAPKTEVAPAPTPQERVQATLNKSVEKMESIVNGSDPRWVEAVNAQAKELGFTKYKALKNQHKKATGSDRENLLGLRNICIRAGNRAAA